MTPYEAQFGRKSVLVNDVIMNHQLPSSTKLKDISDFTFALRESALYINDVIRENTSLVQEKQQMHYNRFVKNRAEFKIGDIVKINNYKTRVGFSKAFEPKFLGPYRIVKLVGELNYQLEGENLAPQMVHYNRMLHYNVRTELMIDQKPVLKPTSPEIVIQDTSSHYVAPENTLLDIIITGNQLKILKKRRAEHLLTEEYERLNLIECLSENNQIYSNMHLRRSLRLNTLRLVDAVEEQEEIEKIEDGGRFYISSDSSIEEETPDQLVNEKGKPVVLCPKCNKLYEQKTGLRIHRLTCLD